jgi:hypothetical protein
MKLHLTFSEKASEGDRSDAIACARDHGATAIEPMFPQPALPELARYFIVEVDGKDVERLVEAMRARDGVQAIERGPRRRALRGA